MQFTLGMPFLGVLGKFHRNRKGLNSERVSVCQLILCVKYIYLCKELVTLYNKVSFVKMNVINMNEQCIYYIHVLIFVNVG